MNRHANTGPRVVARVVHTLAMILVATTLLSLRGSASAGVILEDDPFGASVTAETIEANDELYSGGAPLKTEPELEELLKRAQLFADDGQYRHATTLWQKVLTDSGDTLVTVDGRTYWALTEAVERTIAKLPASGLRIYRVIGDGGAREILAARAGDEEAALAEVVRKYFLSSIGDDAAYKLGCMALDRYDFVGASRLFRKVLEEHPDPSIPLAQVKLRLAVATGHIGDTQSALATLAEIKDLDGEQPRPEVLAAVEDDIRKAGDATVDQRRASQDWRLELGGPSRDGHMQRLPARVPKSTLQTVWSLRFPVGFTTSPDDDERVHVRERGQAERPEPVADDVALTQAWNNGQWIPSSQLLISDGRVFLKTNSCLTSWDADAKSKYPAWRTVWLNLFQMDQNAFNWVSGKIPGVVSGGGTKPADAQQYLYFADRVQRSMSIANGLVFSIEGKRIGKEDVGTYPSVIAQQQHRGGSAPRRARSNYLAAYDERTGKVRWYRGPKDVEEGKAEEENSGLGFMGAPVPYGNMLLVPVTDGGTIWLYAFSQQDGKTVWKSYLCDEPAGGVAPTPPIGVSVAGRDAYVVCGTGVVFAVDAASGMIRYAVRYPRQWPTQNINTGYGVSGIAQIDGWWDDIAVPYGHVLVVMASDHCYKDEGGARRPMLFALDRRTGAMLWRSPRTPFDHPASYCLGVADGGFFVAGHNVVRRYGIVSGRLEWEKEFDKELNSENQISRGRGVLTGDAIYLPVNNSIATFDLKTGELLGRVGVNDVWGQPTTDPIGNLYSDGQKLWVVAGNGVYAVTNLQQKLAMLDKQIGEGRPSAYFDRMRLLAAEGKIDQALQDLAAGFKLTREQQGVADASKLLLAGINEIQLPLLRPQAALDVLTEAYTGASSQECPKDLLPRRADILFAALRTVFKQATPGAASSVLRAVPLLQTDDQFSIARQALAATGTADDLELLQSAVAGGNEVSILVAADALAKVGGEAATAALEPLLKLENENIRFAVARALINAGNRAALGALVDLLSSSDARVRSRSVGVLRSVSGKQFEYSAFGDEAARGKGVEAWRAWVTGDGGTAELALPLPEPEPLLGRTLICFYGANQVVELDADGSKRWEVKVDGPAACEGLPNGHRLVALYGGKNAVIEFDSEGVEVWRQDNLPGTPFSVRRLANGNTLVACSSIHKVVEYQPDGNVAWQVDVPNRPVDARRLENGNTLIALAGSGRVVEVDSAGTVLWLVDGLPGAQSAQRLENGNTLVVVHSEDRVIEVDRDGQEVWAVENLDRPFDAQRLPNGNTLIAANDGVREVDSSGEVVWQLHENGPTGISRY